MIPKDPAHAARILKALVEQGEERLTWIAFSGMDIRRTLLSALVEGAKTVLDKWYKVLAHQQTVEASSVGRVGAQDAYDSERETEIWDNRVGEAAEFICALAQAYVPKMKKMGMEVPE